MATWMLDTLGLRRKTKSLFSSPPPFFHYCTAKTKKADPLERSVKDFPLVDNVAVCVYKEDKWTLPKPTDCSVANG